MQLFYKNSFFVFIVSHDFQGINPLFLIVAGSDPVFLPPISNDVL